MKRIGIDARMYSAKFTGIGRYNYELIEHVTKNDPDNTYVIFLNSPEFESFQITRPNIEKIRVNANHYSLKEQTKFLWILWKAKLDLMHFTHFNSPLLYFGKQVVTIHDLTLSYFPGKKMTSLIYRTAYNLSIWSVTKKASKIIAISENTKKDLMKLLKIPETKIQLIYEGASDSFYKIADQKLLNETKTKYNLTKPFLLYAGVWRSHKNVEGLIQAFKILKDQKDQYKMDADLVITGKQDPLYNEIPDTITNLGLQNDVKLVGLVPEQDLVALFNLAKLYVFPSFYEGFGLPALEAFSVDLPVVSSNTSCLPEICGENNAIFFDPYNHQDMAEKIFSVYSSPEIQEKLKKNGKER